MEKVLEELAGAADHRPLPFWSWNDRLERDELMRQIEQLRDWHAGGFFMHARGGLETEYLGEDWFACIEACMEKADACGMEAWAYDENGWPSGFAGMKLLKDPENFAYYLTCRKGEAFDESAYAVYREEDGALTRCFGPAPQGGQYLAVFVSRASSVVDILEKRVVERFLAETHERYRERLGADLGRRLIGFFTDEPQYYRWNTAYSPAAARLYRSWYGEDVRDGIGYLFAGGEKAYPFRYRYWKVMNHLFLHSFAETVYDWCERNGCRLTGHGIEESSLFGQMMCCGGLMPFYEYEHMPGIDWLGRWTGHAIAARQVGSAAAQLGKKQVLTETFGCSGWGVTPRELKRIAEYQYCGGVNRMCCHLMAYSVRGQRKRDYPMTFSAHTPWHPFFAAFNDYFTRLGALLAAGTDVADVAVLHPMRSAYLLFRREDEESLAALDAAFCETAEKLARAQIAHHYVDETLLARWGSTENGLLRVGECRYRCLVLPDCLTVDASTERLLSAYAAAGGRILLDGRAPRYLAGEPHEFPFLYGNTSWEELKRRQFVRIDKPDTVVRTAVRRYEWGHAVLAINPSRTDTERVVLRLATNAVKLLDLTGPAVTPCAYVREAEGVAVPLTLEPGESRVLVADGTGESAPVVAYAPRGRVEGLFTLALAGDNYLTLDYVALSFDGKDFGPALPVPGAMAKLLKMRYDGTVWLKYAFTVRETPRRIRLEAEDMHVLSAAVNGRSVPLRGPGTLDKSFLQADISGLVRPGGNEAVLSVRYRQSKRVYDVLFDDPDATESLRNCLSFDTEIESCYLAGDFGVFAEGGLALGKPGTLTASGGFALAALPQTVAAACLPAEGLPFFAGAVTLSARFFWEGGRCALRLTGDYAVAEARVNGGAPQTLLFARTADISDFVRAGENELSLTLWYGCRNLYGPHHWAADEDPEAVSPRMFDMEGTWKDGKSPNYAARYAFAAFGLKDVELLAVTEEEPCV